MRSKEEAHDYRYFPEPDLPPLVVDEARRIAIEASLPELPEARLRRLVAQYALPEYDANLLTQSRALADYFEATARAAENAKAASNWIMGELLRTMKEREIVIEQVPLAPEALAALIRIVDRGTISSTVAKEVFAKMYATGGSAEEIVQAEGLAQIGDEDALVGIVRDAIATNPDAVEQFRKGRNNAFGFLVGSVMKASKGKANPKVVNELLKRELGSP
jgi:aspartyl-tRNA(Asn)/glutamyl-tRNA(Gln) amidotransferase subunit B